MSVTMDITDMVNSGEQVQQFDASVCWRQPIRRSMAACFNQSNLSRLATKAGP